TPDRARELLALNTLPSQRNLGTNRGAYKMAVTAIRAGQWHLTHQGIAISDKGHLLDGQHRLHAVIETGIAINSIVAYGVPEESFTDIDSGAARRTADFLSGKYAGDRTTVVRTLLAIEAADGWARPESIRPDSSTRRQEVEYYEARPDLQAYIDKYAPAATRVRPCSSEDGSRGLTPAFPLTKCTSFGEETSSSWPQGTAAPTATPSRRSCGERAPEPGPETVPLARSSLQRCSCTLSTPRT